MYAIELRDEGNYGFELPAELIVVTAQEAKAATFVFARHVAGLKEDEDANDNEDVDADIERQIDERARGKGNDSGRQCKTFGTYIISYIGNL